MTLVTENSKLKVHYTGKLSDGEIFDSSKAVDGTQFTDRPPLDIELGKGQIIIGFEKGLQGMKEGEKKTITVPSSEAYGDIREDHFQEIPKGNVPDTVKVGEMLQAQNPQGQTMNVVVKEIKESTVVIDANHPLAGKDLVFDLEVVSIS